MKKIILSLLFASILTVNVNAQEKYSALNLGVGFGFYGVGFAPAFMLNYEIDIFRNATIAPFVGFSTYKSKNNYWNSNTPFGASYGYRETLIPIGGKFHYYFDELFNAGPKWDFYAAGSLGFAMRTRTWDNGYMGDTDIDRASPLFATIHIGSEVHLSEKAGLFLDLSSGMNTFGLALHF